MRPYLRAANVTWNGIDTSDVKEMHWEAPEVETFELHPGDILLNEASGSPNEVGKPAIYRGEVPGACFQNTLLRVRTRGSNNEYLFWYFKFQALTGRFGEAGRGVNIRHLGKKGLVEYPIPIPPLAEQQRIATCIEEVFTRLDQVMSSLGLEGLTVAEKATGGMLGKVNQLRHSVLTKAFAGLLVLQDPADEPASVLLDRIRAEREATPKKRGRVKA